MRSNSLYKAWIVSLLEETIRGYSIDNEYSEKNYKRWCKSRKASIFFLRSIIITVLIEEEGLSRPRVGSLFYKDHSTITTNYHSTIGRVLDKRPYFKEYSDKYKEIRASLEKFLFKGNILLEKKGKWYLNEYYYNYLTNIKNENEII